MIRLILLLLIIGFIDFYAFQALKAFMQDWSAQTQQTVTIGYWSVTGLFVLFMALSAFGAMDWMSNKAFANLRNVFMILYLSKFVTALVLFIGDIVTWIGQQIQSTGTTDKGRSKFLGQLAVFIGAIPFLTLLKGMSNVYRYKIRKVKVKLDNLPTVLKGLKIVQISDIHSGSLDDKAKIQRGVDLINEQNADLVFFTGDLVNNQSSEALPFLDVFAKIKAKHGVYSVLGNHDYGDYRPWGSEAEKQANFDLMLKNHKDMGMNLLLNRHEVLTINGEKVGVIGVENTSGLRHFHSYGDLAKATEDMEKVPLKLLLSHDPTHWDKEINTDFSDIDITFSGHTHGSQIGLNIPGFIKWSPVKWIYRQWAGLYQKEKQYLYVNVGFGVLGYRGRVGMLPEITVMELA